jgi:hypothetical protein
MKTPDNLEPKERFDRIKTEIARLQLGFDLPDDPGIVSRSNLRFGIFILPDNKFCGTLENILIECGENSYRHLIELSREYIDKIDKFQLKPADLKEFNKPAGKNKALVGSVSNILKPQKFTGLTEKRRGNISRTGSRDRFNQKIKNITFLEL